MPTVPTIDVAPAWKEIAETFEALNATRSSVSVLPVPEAGHELGGGDVAVDLA